MAVAIAVGMHSPGASAQARIELKLSHNFPPNHGIQKDFLEPWAADLETRTKGQVKVRTFDVSSPLGNPASQLEKLESGAIDIAHGMQGAYGKRFARTEVIEMPFLTENADVASRILWAL